MKHRCTQASYPSPIPNLSLHKYRLENFSDDHLFATGSKNVWAGRVKVKLSSTREAAISLCHFESQWKKKATFWQMESKQLSTEAPEKGKMNSILSQTVTVQQFLLVESEL